MRNTPFVPTFVCKKFCARQIKDLPPIVPRCRVFLAISLHKVGPDLFLICRHLSKPVLLPVSMYFGIDDVRPYFRGLCVMFARDPPLLLKLHILLEVVEEIRAWHCTPGKEVSSHPAVLEIIRRGFMSKDMHKQLATRFKSPCNLGHEKCIIFHMFKQLGGRSTTISHQNDGSYLNRYHSVEGLLFELIVYDITSNHCNVSKPFLFCFGINILLLRSRVGKSLYLGIWHNFRKIQCS